jgi:hypothetical protein
MVYIYFSNSLIIHEQNRKATTAQRKQYINRVSVHHQHINTSKYFKKTRLAPRISNTLSRVWYAGNKHLLVYYILLFFASLASTIYNGTELRHTDHNGTELRASFQLRKSYGQTCRRRFFQKRIHNIDGHNIIVLCERSPFHLRFDTNSFRTYRHIVVLVVLSPFICSSTRNTVIQELHYLDSLRLPNWKYIYALII